MFKVQPYVKRKGRTWVLRATLQRQITIESRSPQIQYTEVSPPQTTPYYYPLTPCV